MGRQRLPKPDPTSRRPDLKPLKRCRPKCRRTRLRKSISPGKILIVTRGPYISKKVVFLKQLDSGLLLTVCLNNNAVRRFPQKFCLATSKSVEMNAAVKNALNNWEDTNFSLLKPKEESADGDFFEKADGQGRPEAFTSQENELVAAVDDSINDKYLKYYLRARFTLDKDIPPHLYVF